jgi:hypothetical protein
MTNETSDYSDFDFGFTAVDADELEHGEEIADSQATEESNEISSILVDKIDEMESKMTAVIVALESQGDSGDFTIPNDDLVRIEEKIDKIVTLETNELAELFSEQGESIKVIIDEVEEKKGQLEEEYKEKMEDVENLIMPLLYNLLKNPDKEYILWPNRTEVIQKQIDKILNVTR